MLIFSETQSDSFLIVDMRKVAVPSMLSAAAIFVTDPGIESHKITDILPDPQSTNTKHSGLRYL